MFDLIENLKEDFTIFDEKKYLEKDPIGRHLLTINFMNEKFKSLIRIQKDLIDKIFKKTDGSNFIFIKKV